MMRQTFGLVEAQDDCKITARPMIGYGVNPEDKTHMTFKVGSMKEFSSKISAEFQVEGLWNGIQLFKGAKLNFDMTSSMAMEIPEAKATVQIKCYSPLEAMVNSLSAQKSCQKQVTSSTPPDPPPRPVEVASHKVTMAVSLPFTKDEFDSQKQSQFKKSLASAAKVSTDDVSIDKIETLTAARRRLLQGSIRVDTSIKAADKGQADAIASQLTEDNINAELEAELNVKATLLEKPSVAQVTANLPTDATEAASEEETGLAPGWIALIVVGLVVVMIGGGWAVYQSQHPAQAQSKADDHLAGACSVDSTSHCHCDCPCEHAVTGVSVCQCEKCALTAVRKQISATGAHNRVLVICQVTTTANDDAVLKAWSVPPGEHLALRSASNVKR